MTADAGAVQFGPTAELLARLHDHFIKPGETWAGAVCLTEVTAPGGSRRADLVHVGLWNSRGAGAIDVCELKTSRSDFRRELESPAKAEAWWPFCNRFWIVSPGEHITPPGELPPGWGLMVPKPGSRRFRVVVKPAEHEAKLSPALLVTLLKSTETTRINALHRQQRELQDQHSSELTKARREAASAADPSVRDRLELLDALEARLGCSLTEYAWRDEVTPTAAADALRALALGATGVEAMRRDLQYRARDLEALSGALAENAKKLRVAAGPARSED